MGRQVFGNTQEISPQSAGLAWSRAFPYDTIPYPGHSFPPDRRNEPAVGANSMLVIESLGIQSAAIRRVKCQGHNREK